MKNTKTKVFFKNFAAGRKALFAKIGVCIGSALAVHQVVSWVVDTEFIANILKSIQYNSIDLYNVLTTPWIYLIIAFLFALITQGQFSQFGKKINNGTDCSIEISMDDIFSNKGQILVPCNNIFASDLNLIGNKSIQAQMVERMKVSKKANYTAEEYISSQIKEALQKDEYKKCEIKNEQQTLAGKTFQVYEYGTIVPVSVNVDKKQRNILLLAMSSISSPGVPVVDRATLIQNIDKMWDYIAANHTDSDTIVVPIMGTGAARVPMEKQVVARYILYSFAERSAELGIKKLILSIYPDDYINDKINLEELKSYATFLCKFPNSDFSI